MANSKTGYGNIAPSTEGGKIFCILYAIFGIPLFGFLLAGVGDQLGTIFVKSIAKVEKMFRVGEIKAHAAEWKANVRAEFRETRRRMSVEVHDKLQRAATIRSMERRQLGLDQRAVSLDILSPERRALFNALDTNSYKTSSQESIDTKLNNLRLRGSEHSDRNSTHHTTSEDNIFNRLGSVTKLAKRNRNRDLRKNIPDEARRPRSEAYGYSIPTFDCSTTTIDDTRRNNKGENENEDKECNNSLSDFPLFVEACKRQNVFTPEQTKENEKKLEKTKELHIQIGP
ncbi:Potassium channel subfamily K member 10 [Channa argus]|uniref:Potassium channel subfamily K member 10 n=1 Tax=Channa argus TaxID=215402 RepID=A0A6G1QIY6_CHAAH|nr:Potassium channel subfamily K member 10 [Channa argus]